MRDDLVNRNGWVVEFSADGELQTKRGKLRRRIGDQQALNGGHNNKRTRGVVSNSDNVAFASPNIWRRALGIHHVVANTIFCNCIGNGCEPHIEQHLAGLGQCAVGDVGNGERVRRIAADHAEQQNAHKQQHDGGKNGPKYVQSGAPWRHVVVAAVFIVVRRQR